MEKKEDCIKRCTDFTWVQKYKYTLDLMRKPNNDWACISYSTFINPLRLELVFMGRCVGECLYPSKLS